MGVPSGMAQTSQVKRKSIADREFGIPALGTMAHSWVQVFPTEYDAFRAYAETYPDR